MNKAAIFVMIATLLAKAMGFVRELVLSYCYGASSVSDAYIITLTIPTTIFAFVGSAIVTSYIPMYNNIKKEVSIKEADKFTSNIIILLIIIATLVVIFVSLFTEQVIKIFAMGFEGETLILATKLTKIMIFAVYFVGIVHIFTGYLNIKNTFIGPATVAIPMNICIVVSILISTKTNLIILAVGSLIAVFLQVVYLAPLVIKKGYVFTKEILDNKKYIKQMIYLALPVMLGVCVNEINTLIDKSIASQVAVGGISALNYANRLNAFVQGIFVVSVVTVLYPKISQMASENNIKGLKNSVSEAMVSISIFVIPATVGAMIFSEPIIQLLFGRGSFDINAVKMTSIALFFYSIGMISFGMREILAKTFYSIQDTKTPMINASIAVVINIILNITLSKIMGIGGLALATSISSLICTSLLLISLRRKMGSFGMIAIVKSLIKIIVAAIFMGIFAKGVYTMIKISLGGNLALIISIILGAIIYGMLIYFMKIKEVEELIKSLKSRVEKKAM